MVQSASRRNFLRSAPLAAAVALPLTEKLLFAAQGASSPTSVPFQLFPAAKLAEATKQLQAKPGNDNLFVDPALPLTLVLTSEEKHAAKEFEWHEGRDHIFQIIDGATVYELGGTPQNGRSTGPGEWLAPASTGTTTVSLRKGDMLLIPRSMPHKRTTEASVTFYLISTTSK